MQLRLMLVVVGVLSLSSEVGAEKLALDCEPGEALCIRRPSRYEGPPLSTSLGLHVGKSLEFVAEIQEESLEANCKGSVYATPVSARQRKKLRHIRSAEWLETLKREFPSLRESSTTIGMDQVAGPVDFDSKGLFKVTLASGAKASVQSRSVILGLVAVCKSYVVKKDQPLESNHKSRPLLIDLVPDRRSKGQEPWRAVLERLRRSTQLASQDSGEPLTPTPTPSSAQDEVLLCHARGGEYCQYQEYLEEVPAKEGVTFECKLNYADGGKPCTSSSECLSNRCEVAAVLPEVVAQCQRTSFDPYACWSPRIEDLLPDGRVPPVACPSPRAVKCF